MPPGSDDRAARPVSHAHQVQGLKPVNADMDDMRVS
jgi:hypothetical protein